MKNLIIMVICLIVFVSPLKASEEGWMAKGRNLVEKMVGEGIASKIFGRREKTEIKFPPLPKIEKSSKTFSDIEEKKTKIKNEEKYNYLFIEELFLAVRNTSATRDELAKWMNVMNQGATREGVYRALVLDNYYARMENYNETSNPEAVKFALFFMENYLEKTVKKEMLAEMNFYTMKRLIGEQTLDLIDAFANNRDHLSDWYGLLSQDFASFYHQYLKGKVRKNKDPHWHKNWALTAPRQHMIGEALLKLHHTLNGLQGK